MNKKIYADFADFVVEHGRVRGILAVKSNRVIVGSLKIDIEIGNYSILLDSEPQKPEDIVVAVKVTSTNELIYASPNVVYMSRVLEICGIDPNLDSPDILVALLHELQQVLGIGKKGRKGECYERKTGNCDD